MRNRNILAGILWTALVASAVIVPSASAQFAKGTSAGPTTLKGTEAGTNSFTAFGTEMKCPGSTYTGHKAGATPHVFLPSGATEATLTAHLVNCTFPYHTNGCDTLVRDGTTTGGLPGTYGGVADLVCPAGVAGAVITGAFGCNTTIPPQNGLTGLHQINTAKDWDLAGTVNGVRAINSCLGETKTAQLHINVTIKAYNSLGEEVSGTISE
jgi:hypothetical protein